MKNGSGSNFATCSKSGNGAYFVPWFKWLFSIANIRRNVPLNLFFATALFFLLIFPTFPSCASNLDGEKLVQDITEMVLPEVQNYATIALGVVFAVLLVRSFK